VLSRYEKKKTLHISKGKDNTIVVDFSDVLEQKKCIASPSRVILTCDKFSCQKLTQHLFHGISHNRGNLQTIREEVREGESREPESADIPAPPAEAVSVIWKASWAAAHTAILARCASLNNDRDQLREALQVASDDTQALVDEVTMLDWILKKRPLKSRHMPHRLLRRRILTNRRLQRSLRGWMKYMRKIHAWKH